MKKNVGCTLATLLCLVGLPLQSAHIVLAAPGVSTTVSVNSATQSLTQTHPDNQFIRPRLAPTLAHLPAGMNVPVIIMLHKPTGRVHLFSASQAVVNATLQSHQATNITALPLINGVAATVNSGAVQALLRDSEVTAVLQDSIYHPFPIPDQQAIQDALLQQAQSLNADSTSSGSLLHPGITAEPEALQLIHADAAHREGITGRGVRVAIVDSGFDINQPDMQGVLAKDAHGQPLRVDFTDTDLTDTVGHGTACASMIVAQGKHIYSTINSHFTGVWPASPNQVGQRALSRFTIQGMAPDVKIMSAKIFDTRVDGGGGQESWIVRAIQWAIDNHADIISESFGGLSLPATGDDPIALADEAAVHAGIVVLAANGNSGPGNTTVGSPAAAPDIIAVGASTMWRQFGQTGFLTYFGKYQSDNIAAFTSRGPTWDGRVRPDIFSPGAFGWAEFPTNVAEENVDNPPNQRTYGTFGGTSQATPIAAGVAALAIQAFREAHPHQPVSPAYIKNVLMSSADDLGYPAFDQSSGRINALRAVNQILHRGASFDVSPNALSLHALPGASLRGEFTVTNTGTKVEHLSFDVQGDVPAKTLSFSGQTLSNLVTPYVFHVPPGVAKLTATINWRGTDKVTLGDQSQNGVGLRVALYDPYNRFINYGQGNGSGFVTTYAAHPIPGRWTAVVRQNPASDKLHPPHNYFRNESYTGQIVMDNYPTVGSVTPARANLKPGAHQTFTVELAGPSSPLSDLVSIHVRGSHVATIPVARTAAIPFIDDQGAFSGQLTGAAANLDTGGLETEFHIYNFPVQPNTSNISVALSWPDPGYGIYALLLDPHGNVVDNTFNAQQNALDPTAPLDLSRHNEQMFWTNPEPGNWQIAINNLYYSGLQHGETYQGLVTLNQGLVSPDQITRDVKPGGSTIVHIHVHNNGLAPQSFFGYATTDDYVYTPVQAVAGPLGQGNPVITNTQTFTFSTGFVPPTTKMVLSYAASITPSIPIDLVLYDPFFSHPAEGVAGPVSFAGSTYQGTTAVLNRTETFAGSFYGVITLNRPKDERTTTTIMGSTLAYTLQPNPWISFYMAFNNGTIQGRPLSLKAAQSGDMPMRIEVPTNTAPGTYQGHVFVYTLNGDQMGNIPLTINVPAVPKAPEPGASPLLNAVASTVYFPEGNTASGNTVSFDLLNTSNSTANTMLSLSEPGGQVAQTTVSIAPHSHTSLDVNKIVGSNQAVATMLQSDHDVAVGRVILRSDKSGSYSLGAATPSKKWYFADGYTVDTFSEQIVLFNPQTTTTHVILHMLADNPAASRTFQTSVPPLARVSINLDPLVPSQALSTIVSADQPIVAERVQTFGSDGEGITNRIGATTPSTDLYFDAGNGVTPQQAHMALFNPGGKAAQVEITYTDADGNTLGFKILSLLPNQRSTIDLNATLQAQNVAAYVHSSEPIVAEKVTYFGQIKASKLGGSDSFGAPAAAPVWTFPGGTSGFGFQEYVALANPVGTKSSTVLGTFFYGKGQVYHHLFHVNPQQRLVINVNRLPGLPRGTHGSQFTSANGVNFYASQSIVYLNRTAGLDVLGLTQ